MAGATVLPNLSGSPITVARAEDRPLLVRSACSRCLAAYVFAAAGQGESTTDLSWDRPTMVYECGDLLGETERFPGRPASHRWSTSTCCGSGRTGMRQGTSTTIVAPFGPADGVSHVEFELPEPTGDVGLRR